MKLFHCMVTTRCNMSLGRGVVATWNFGILPNAPIHFRAEQEMETCWQKERKQDLIGTQTTAEEDKDSHQEVIYFRFGRSIRRRKRSRLFALRWRIPLEWSQCVTFCVCVCTCDIIQRPRDSTLGASGVDVGGRRLQVGVTSEPLSGIWQEASGYLTDLLTATHKHTVQSCVRCSFSVSISALIKFSAMWHDTESKEDSLAIHCYTITLHPCRFSSQLHATWFFCDVLQ